MGLFDNFNLPRLSGGGSVSDSVISYAVAPLGQLLNESYAKVQTTFGNAGNFLALSSKSPSFVELGSENGALGVISNTNNTPGLAASAANTGIASGTASQLNEQGEGTEVSTTSHKVMLTASVFDGATSSIQNDVNFPVEPLTQHRVEFDIMPEVSEVRTAEYEPISAPQMPGEFQKYRGTKSTQWTITATFAARTSNEAKRNYIYLNTLRGWTMPYFGAKQQRQFSAGKLGAPPPVIQFSGWRGLVGGDGDRGTPVVITTVNWTWPKDVDWLPTGIIDSKSGQEIPFPAVMTVTINMVESFSAQQFNGFDLVAFRNGRMVDAFTALPSPQGDVSRSEAIGGQQQIVNGSPTTVVNSPTSEANEIAASPAQNPAPTPGLPNAETTPRAKRISEISKEIASLNAAREEYGAILFNPASSANTKNIMATSSTYIANKINDLQNERSKLMKQT